MNNSSSRSHHRVQPSTTLNRKYVKRPTASAIPSDSPSENHVDEITTKIRAERLKERQARAEQINQEQLAMLKKKRAVETAQKAQKDTESASQSSKKEKKSTKKHHVLPKLSSKSRKTSKKSKTASTQTKTQKTISIPEKSTTKSTTPKSQKSRSSKKTSFFSFKRIMLALGCSLVTVAVIAYFVNMNMPNISLSIASIQNDINAVEPSYVPRGYIASSIVAEKGKVSITYKSSDNKSFTLTEQKSTWDSSALESNYVKSEYSDYSTMREQGLTIFISGSNCTWVNGGKVFTIDGKNSGLTKKQIQSIATSF